MMPNVSYSEASSAQIIKDLGGRMESIRLSKNLTQAQVAQSAGVSEPTMVRLEGGHKVSLDTFVRVMTALGLANHLAALLPDPNVRPVDRIKRHGTERRRASPEKAPREATPWQWGDESKTDD